MIGMHLKALRGTKWYEHGLRFCFGGACTVVAGWIAQRWGPVVGGMFLAFPAIFPAGLSLIEKHEKQKKQEVGADGTRRGQIACGVDAEGTALGALALLAFALVIWKGMPRFGAGWVVASAAAAWMASAAGLWGLYRVRWTERIRRARRS